MRNISRFVVLHQFNASCATTTVHINILRVILIPTVLATFVETHK